MVHIFVMLKNTKRKKMCRKHIFSLLRNGPSRLKYKDSNFTLAADGEAREKENEERGKEGGSHVGKGRT